MRVSEMKIETIMKPNHANIGSRVWVELMQDTDKIDAICRTEGVKEVTFALPDGEGVAAHHRYKVTVERIEDAE